MWTEGSPLLYPAYYMASIDIRGGKRGEAGDGVSPIDFATGPGIVIGYIDRRVGSL